MRACVAIILLLLTGCDHSAPGASNDASELPKSPCEIRFFERARFTICSAADGQVEIVTSDSSGAPFRNFSNFEAALGTRASQVAFAMNAGIFDEDGHAIGF